MGRPKGSKNKQQIKILYPRKCNYCDYISNNPAMWHYHNKTHQPIPAEQKCEHGCGSLSNFLNTKGRYTCTKIAHHCPEYLKTHSDRIKSHWERSDASIRKENAKKTFLQHCVGNENAIAKLKETKRKKSGLLTPDDARNFRHYARAIRARAQVWAVSQGYKLGKQTYHVDHKLSILDAWNAKLPASVVNHPANLRIIEAKENSSKGSKSIITVEELYALINNTFSE